MRKRTRRKHYTLVNPISYAIEGACITPAARLDPLRLRELAAIEAFAKGNATLVEWHDIQAMLNVAENMARNGLGIEVLEACQRAEAALVEAARRFEATGRMGTSGPGIVAFRDLYQYHDLQRISVSRSVYEKQIEEATNRVRSRAPEVTVLK